MKSNRTIILLVTCLCLLFACTLAVQAQDGGEAVFTETYDTITVTVYSNGLARYEGVGTVRSGMFPWGYDVTRVEIGEGITEIGDDAFRGTMIESVSFPSTLRTIGICAFYECVKLTSVVLPEGLVNIGSGAFFDSGLTSVTIPDSVTSLAYDVPFGESVLGAFDCPNLSEVKLGKGITEIPWGAFCGNPIRTIEIPDGVKRIDAYAFGACKQLTSVTIPASVEYIGGFAFVNTFSLTNVIFLGDAPQMDNPFFCASFNGTAFYPKGNPTWEADVANVLWQSGDLLAAIPFTIDVWGNIIPEAPSVAEVDSSISWFASQTYPEGSDYPDNYSYILNGNMMKVHGKEGFAFELSDACFGYLPISELRIISYDALRVGDILYSGDDVWVIMEKNDSDLTLAGVQNQKVVYGVPMTKSQVQDASAYRTRVKVSPYPGEVDPAQSEEKVTGPDRVLTESEVYNLLVSLQDQFPESMPYSSKNHYHSNVVVGLDDGSGLSPDGHGCSAFSYYLSDIAFGDLPAWYYNVGKFDYNSMMVGDRLLGIGHEVVVLEVYSDCVVVVEGNYDGRIHWGRKIPREEIETEYALVTRYPKEIADQLKDLVSSDAVSERIREVVRNMDTAELTEALKTNNEAAENLAALEEKTGGPADVVVEDTSMGIEAQDVQIVGANLNSVIGESATLVIAASEQSNAIPENCETNNAVQFSMTLENVANTEELDVPVKIVLPIPEDLEPNRVAVVHYHGADTEVLKPAVEEIDGKYYASIVIDGFSDFAIVQKKHVYAHQYDYKCDFCGAERTVNMTRDMMDMYRMYDPNSGEHFYTGSVEERDFLVSEGWQYEGIGFTFPLTTGKPVHRLYDPVTGEHLYTMDEAEKEKLIAEGWNYEGVAFNSGFENEVPQYRLHNPNETRGAYHFTASIEERDFLISLGWEYQGIGWYSMGG